MEIQLKPIKLDNEFTERFKEPLARPALERRELF